MSTATEAGGLRRTIAGVIPVTAATQVLGFASSVVMAEYLGATRDTDAYYLALLLPGLASGVIVAALRQGAIPALTEAGRNDEGPAFSETVSALVIAVSAIALVLAIALAAVGFAGFSLAAPDWPAKYLDRVVFYSLLLVPFTVGAAAQGAMTAALAVRGSFRIAIAIYGFESVAKILFVVLLTSLGGYSLVFGNLAGQALGVAALVFSLHRRGVRLSLVNPKRYPILRKALIVTAPLLVSASVIQVNPFIDKGVAAGLGGGQVTALELAQRLALIPEVLLAGSLITPLVATWSSMHESSGWQSVERSFLRTIRLSWLAAALITAVGFPLRDELIEIVYGRGMFTEASVELTAAAFGALLFTLPASMSMIACSSLFVVRKETVFPMKVGFSNVALNTVLTIALASLIGLPGVALGTALTMTVNLLTYLVGISRRWRSLSLGVLSIPAIRALAAGAAAAAATTAVADLLASSSSDPLVASVPAAMAGLAAFGLTVVAVDPDARRSFLGRFRNA